MRVLLLIWATSLAILLTSIARLDAQNKEALRLVQTIPLPKVHGRMDHMDVDIKGKRLFVAGLENGSVEIVDLRAGKWTRSISGFQKPQGIVYAGSLNKLFVASGDDGMLRVFRGDTLELRDSITLGRGANRVAYDLNHQLLYVGYGGKDAGKDFGEVGIVDARTNKHIGDVPVVAHPAELLLDKSGNTLYVFIPVPSKIHVVDTRKRQVVSTWPVSSEGPGDAAFDEATHRLLIATRVPPLMIAMDSRSGKEVANQPTVEGMDGAYFDAAHHRVYVSGGRGFDVGHVFAYQQKDADTYETIGKIQTRPGTGTSFWSPELNRYYVAAPAHDDEEAAILVFEPQL